MGQESVGSAWEQGREALQHLLKEIQQRRARHREQARSYRVKRQTEIIGPGNGHSENTQHV